MSLLDLIQSPTTAWGVFDIRTGTVRAYRSCGAACKALEVNPRLRLAFYHPEHEWVEAATHRRVSDGRKPRWLR